MPGALSSLASILRSAGELIPTGRRLAPGGFVPVAPFNGQGVVVDASVCGTVLLAVAYGRVWSCGRGVLGRGVEEEVSELTVRRCRCVSLSLCVAVVVRRCRCALS